jgi:hypothetical protein
MGSGLGAYRAHDLSGHLIGLFLVGIIGRPNPHARLWAGRQLALQETIHGLIANCALQAEHTQRRMKRLFDVGERGGRL